jgi:hypothetical protein
MPVLMTSRDVVVIVVREEASLYLLALFLI